MSSTKQSTKRPATAAKGPTLKALKTIKAHAQSRSLANKAKGPIVTLKQRRWSRRTYAIRAIRRAQANSYKIASIDDTSMRRLVNSVCGSVYGSQPFISKGVVPGLRDVADHFVHDILKSARRMTHEQSNAAWTLTAKSVQGAAARWAQANPRFIDFFVEYEIIRDEMGLPTIGVQTDYRDAVLGQVLARRMIEEKNSLKSASTAAPDMTRFANKPAAIPVKPNSKKTPSGVSGSNAGKSSNASQLSGSPSPGSSSTAEANNSDPSSGSLESKQAEEEEIESDVATDDDEAKEATEDALAQREDGTMDAQENPGDGGFEFP